MTEILILALFIVIAVLAVAATVRVLVTDGYGLPEHSARLRRGGPGDAVGA